MTPEERALLLVVAKAIYNDLDTQFPTRREIKALMDKVAADADDRRDQPSE
jgi:hypothetical protein